MFLCIIFYVNFSAGKIQLSEHEDLIWVTKKELFNYKMAPGDSKIIQIFKIIILIFIF